MAILYITEQGATVRHLGGRIVVRRDERVLQELPDFKLEQLVVFGNVNLTPGFLGYCLQQGVDVAFLSSTGKYRGRLQAELAKNVVLRRKQFEREANAEFRLATAAVIVAAKCRNMIAIPQSAFRIPH